MFRKLLVSAILVGTVSVRSQEKRILPADYNISQIKAVDFTAPLWVTPQVVATDGIKVERVKDGDNFALEILITDTALSNPGIMLRPPKGQLYWDLSEYQILAADIENLDDQGQVIVSSRVTNPLVDTYQAANNSGFALNPHEKRTLRLYYPQADEFAKCRIDGIKATPPGIPGPKNVNGRRVDAIIFWGHNLKRFSRNHKAHYRISNIRLEKPYTGPGAPVDDPAKFYPFVDRYGQYVHQDWPDKIKTDADLKNMIEKERKSWQPRIANWNKYGGWAAGPQLEATGFFRTEKYQGKWFLIDPEGRLFFSHGVNSVTASGQGFLRDPQWLTKDAPIQNGKVYVFPSENLKRKYGDDFMAILPDVYDRRLEAWGLNTIGNWSGTEFYRNHKTPYAMEILPPIVNRMPGIEGRKAGLWDFFDPGFEPALRKRLTEKRMTGVANDPWCLGIFVNNEIQWGDRTYAARSAFLAPPGQPAKQELLRQLKIKHVVIDELNRQWGSSYRSWEELARAEKLPAPERSFEDFINFNRSLFERYFATCRRVVKEFSPNTLYLGQRIHLSNMPELYEVASKYCDVVSRNIYSWSMDGFRESGLPVDKPILISEFAAAVLDRGMFNADPRPAGVTQDDRAHAYLRILQGALLHPQVVGIHYFTWRDQMITGRSIGGPMSENFALGVIDVADTPYWELTAMMRRVAENMIPYRLSGKFECEWDK